MRRLRRPRNPLLLALPWLAAALAAVGCYHVVRELDVEPRDIEEVLPALTLSSAYAQAEERRWIEDAFPEVYLPAPVSDLPCATGVRAARPWNTRISEALSWVGDGRLDDAVAELAEIDDRDPANWVAGLTLGMVLAREGRLGEAEAVLRSLYGRRSVQTTVREAVENAQSNRSGGPDTEDVRGAIHLLHAYGYVLIETHRGGDELWPVLRYPIGCSKLLALRGATDRMRRLPTWAEHRIGAPGCGLTEHSLTTLDLYNNLVVAYLENPGFRGEDGRLERELRRTYADPPHENPLLAILERASAEFPSAELPAEREHWLWAVSNAERLLKQRRESNAGELENVRLAYNLAALMESALAVVPPGARAALTGRKNDLAAVAMAGRRSVLPRQQVELDRALTRLELLEAVRSGTLPPLDDSLTEDLDGAQSEVLSAVAFALSQRRNGRSWLVQVSSPGDAIRASLGRRAAGWLEASRRDFAATLASRAAEAPDDEKPWWARWARRTLEPGDAKPAELRALEKEVGFFSGSVRWLTSPFSAGVAAILAAAVAWIAAAWLAVQLGQRRDLTTSFYRLEARAQLRRGR